MNAWQNVFREGFAPILTTAGLEALAQALMTDDPCLIQEATTVPPPLQALEDWPVQAACAVAYCGWQGDGLATVAEVEEFFARACFQADEALGEPAAGRYFLNFWDDTPREQARREVLAEVNRVLIYRRGLVTSAAA